MTAAPTGRALKYACQRVEDFALVNRVRPAEEKKEATDLWLDHLGLDESLRLQLTDWLERFIGPGWDGDVLIGLAVGLLVHQFHVENS